MLIDLDTVSSGYFRQKFKTRVYRDDSTWSSISSRIGCWLLKDKDEIKSN